jgi:hypothetical protein
VYRNMWLAVVGLVIGSAAARGQEGMIGSIDLMTAKGVQAVKGDWRYHDVTTGVGAKQNGLEPKAHGAFDDAKWTVLKPESLTQGRGPTKYSWGWYRIKITIPDNVGGKPFAGGTVWLQANVDAYGEVWVDGALNHSLKETGRGEVSGYNTPNRVRLQKGPKKDKTDAKPGDVFQIAILAINGPIGNPPATKFSLKPYTRLEFFDAKAPNEGANKPPLAPAPAGKLVGTIDLMSKEGVELVKSSWRRQLITFHTGKDKNEIEPKAHDKFDDSKWEVVEDPSLLKKPFGPGNFSMAWYRINVTLPDKVDGKDIAGSAVWFHTTVDDYAEVYVNGAIDLAGERTGRGAISGFNFPNEVLLTEKAKAGQTIQIAVLAINSPFGNPPGNFIFFRSPTVLRFYKK